MRSAHLSELRLLLEKSSEAQPFWCSNELSPLSLLNFRCMACFSVIRMFLQRRRYLRGKEALRAWRTRHSLRVLQCMRRDVFRQKKIESGLESVRKIHIFRVALALCLCAYGLCASHRTCRARGLTDGRRDR